MTSLKELRKRLKEARIAERMRQAQHRLDILAKRAEYLAEYDAVFCLIMDAIKQSDWHMELLRCEKILDARTRKFVDENAYLFSTERKCIMASMEQKGAFGTRPEWEENPQEFKHYEKANR